MSAPCTFFGLIQSRRPLGVWCRGCGHAALLTPRQLSAADRGEMDSLCQLRLRCALCGSYDWRGKVFHSDQQLNGWVSAPSEPIDIVATYRGDCPPGSRNDKSPATRDDRAAGLVSTGTG